jgi:hypothetical protein
MVDTLASWGGGEVVMTEPKVFSSRALRAAYAMADTGKFEDVEAIKREILPSALAKKSDRSTGLMCGS